MASRPDLEWQFEIALKLGRTRHELIHGRPGPMSGREFARWRAFLLRRAEMEHAGYETGRRDRGKQR